jgi:hypothetical protein
MDSTYRLRGYRDQMTLGSVVDLVLDGHDYDRGIAEAAQATADNCNKAVGRLIVLLHSKGVIDTNEVGDVLGRVIEEVAP